uniref:Uncharacterized protein n=1 Tax=Meloidogyne javanica TaxID=6303 RepID=A0A915MZC9_MELJA
MRNKAKLLLIFALILVLNFNVGATPNNFNEGRMLDNERINRLQQIAKMYNSNRMPRVNSNDLIKLDEYKYLKENVEYKSLFETFNKAFRRLVNKITEFNSQYLDNYTISDDGSKYIGEELQKYDEIVKSDIQEDDEGNLQSAFGKKMKEEYKNVIVDGSSLVGLYAAFRLFMEGMNVTLVNALSEQHLQDRIVSIDRKWIPKLRFFLGTEFNKLFFDNENGGEKSFGRILDEDIGVVNIKNMETVLKERIKKLSNDIIKREGNQPGKSFLNLIYNTAVLDINTDYKKPLAILGAPLNRPESFDLHSLKEILTNYEGMEIFESNKIAIPFDLNSYFLSERIKNRYYYIKDLIKYGMKEVKDNSQIPLTKTGKVYETKEGKILVSKGEIISVQIFETETKIQIDSELPVAIVELIEEIKNEMEDVKKMNDGELKKKWKEAIIAKEKFNYEKNKKMREWPEKEKSKKPSKIEEKQEYILYFDENSLVSSVLQIYGKENKKDSAILVNMDDENTNNGKFIEDK